MFFFRGSFSNSSLDIPFDTLPMLSPSSKSCCDTKIDYLIGHVVGIGSFMNVHDVEIMG